MDSDYNDSDLEAAAEDIMTDLGGT